MLTFVFSPAEFVPTLFLHMFLASINGTLNKSYKFQKNVLKKYISTILEILIMNVSTFDCKRKS